MNMRLKLKIIEKFKTQYRFARAVGIAESFVSLVINELKDIDEKEKTKWAKKLGSTVESLFDT